MIQLTKQETQQLEKVRKAKLEILFTSKDDDENFLVFNMGQLYLRLDKEDRNRKVGRIYYIGDTIVYSKWETETQVFKKMDAWSIPLIIAKNVDVIQFKTPQREYWIEHDSIKSLIKEKEARIMKFDNTEKKVYIPRKFWKETPIISEEFKMTLVANYTYKKPKDQIDLYTQRVGSEWAEVLYDYFETPYMKSIGTGIAKARASGTTMYPEGKDVFKAFRRTPYSKVKVVIFGQDPYTDGNASGLAFDCKNIVSPSMHKIIQGYTEQYPNHFNTDLMDGNIRNWADEGVLLLNTALTVREGKPGSHLKQWHPFISEVLFRLNGRVDKGMQPIVYLLWGKQAKQYKILIADGCPVIETEHPIACVYDGRTNWNHENCFLRANDELQKLGLEKIDW